jgi:hypothetical protein
MRRSRKVTLIVVTGLVLLAAGFLWALPEIVRRVALDQIPKRTGRAVAISDIDLNLFTGRLAIKDFRLADRPDPEPFLEAERLALRLSPIALLRSHIHIVELVLTAPSLRIVRTESGELNFADLLGGTAEPAEPEPPAAPRRWTVTLDRLNIARGRVHVADRGVTPPADWRAQDLDFEATGLTTRAGAPPGRLALRVRIDEARLAASVEPLRIEPLIFLSKVTLDGFESGRLNPYVYIPLGTPYRPKGGRFSLAVTADVDSDDHEVRKAILAGSMSLEREAFARAGHTDPFLSASRVGVEIKEVDALARTLTVANVTLEGLDLEARRDARGVIDVVEIFTSKASPPARPGGPATAAPRPPAAPPKAAPAPSEHPRQKLFPILGGLVDGFREVRVERITLTPSKALLIDEGTKPPTRLPLTKLEARVDDFTWPVKRPATVALSTGLPGGGTLAIKGPVTVQPFDADLVIAIRNAPVEPYQAYIPIPARLSGRYGGDSRNRIAIRDGVLVAQSKGNSWAENVEIREPGAERPAIRVERMELVGIDFDWPKRAAAQKAAFRRPRVEIERSADGSFNVRRLFTPPGPKGATPTPEPAAKSGSGPSGSQPKGLLETMRLEFGEVRIDDGFIRFLDRTTQPAFSQDLSRLAVRVTDLGNRPARRAKLVLQSVVGGDADLDIRGELGALGAPTFVDLVGELQSFNLPSVDPYALAATGWAIKKGELQYKFRFKLDGNQLAADNDVLIGQLQVAPASGSDEVKRRIGLPLGLIVGLIKDQKGEIHVNVPVTGTVNDPKFSLGDAIWTAIKNVLVNVVSAPFKAIGRLFSGGGKTEEPGEKLDVPKVDPVSFEAGSSVLSPAMEDHLLRVADFLRRSPFVSLALTPVPGAGDVAALREEAVAARLREFQKERGVEDAAVALAEYYKERLPDVPLPATLEEQAALLREREPAPDAGLTDLGRRRVQATRERLLTVEGIPGARLTVAEGPAAASGGSAAPREATVEGRVDFAIMAGE